MNPTFRTTDLDLGAAILTAGIPLSDLHRNGDNRTTFSSENSPLEYENQAAKGSSSSSTLYPKL